jgi:hypothetical protein
MNYSKNKNIFISISIIFISLIFLNSLSFADNVKSDSSKNKSIQVVKELIADMDQKYLLDIAKKQDKSKMADLFKDMCKSSKTLGDILKYCENIDDGIFIFQEIKPANIPTDIWKRYFGKGEAGFGYIKNIILKTSNKKNGLVSMFEETGHKAGYILAAFSIAQDIYSALGSNDERRLKAIYTTAKNVLFEFLFKRVGLSLNPFISIGVDVLEWGLNTFIKQSLGRHQRDWERAYERYMDKHYPDKYWNKLIRSTFSEYGGLSQAKTKIQYALERFWENPDFNLNEMINTRSTFSSTRGGALAEKYKQGIIADYYNWEVKPKIRGMLREEIMYARNDARYAAINAIKKLLNNINEDELKNIKKAIEMANDFKKATISIKPEKVTLKPGESKTFTAALNIGGQSMPISNNDIKWSHKGGTFTADSSMDDKSYEVTAIYSGKKGTASVKVGDKAGETLTKSLAEAKKILEQMRKAVSNVQKTINDADELCSSGEKQLGLAQTELPTKEFLERESPLNKYEKLKTSIMKKVDELESIRKKSTNDYTSAGVYKSNCEKKTMKACEGASHLRGILNSKTAVTPPTGPNTAEDNNPGSIMKTIGTAKAKAHEYGNQSLSDIQSVVESGKNAKKIYNSIKESVDTYVKDLHKAKKQQDKEFNKSRKYLKKARSKLSKLYSKVERIKKTENQLKSSSIKATNLLISFKNNEKVDSILKEINKCYKDFVEGAKEPKECYDNLKQHIDEFAEGYMEDRIEYDSRENRENTGRLHVQVKKAYGCLVGINEDVRNSKSLKSAVQTAMKNSKKCEEKAQEFLDKIREIQKERGESENSGSDSSTSLGDTDDTGRCLFLKRAFYSRLFSDRPGHLKRALGILNKAKDCPWYEEGLREYNRHIADDEGGGFSTSGGETVSEDSSSTNRTDKDNCKDLENDFYAALKTGDINWAQLILNKAKDCSFYSRGTNMLQSAIKTQEDENKREEENRCRKLYKELVNATNSNNLSLVKSILAKSRNCSFYDQGVKWVKNAEHNRYCQNLLRNFYNAIRKGQPAMAQRILGNGRKAGCNFPPEANQLLQQAYDLSRQRDIERNRIKNQNMNNLLNSFSNIIRNMNTGRNTPTYKPPAYTPPSSVQAGLTDITVNSRVITVSVWDHGSIDGDRVNVYLNGRLIRSNLLLGKSPINIRLNLYTGSNVVEIKAMNEGSQSPNTASIKITNVVQGKSQQKWQLKSGQTGKMRIRVSY